MLCRRDVRLRGGYVLVCFFFLLLCAWSVLLHRQAGRVPAGVLCDRGGRLCYFAQNGAEPVEYDILTRLLPEAEFEKLRRGVPVYSTADRQKKADRLAALAQNAACR